MEAASCNEFGLLPTKIHSIYSHGQQYSGTTVNTSNREAVYDKFKSTVEACILIIPV